MTRLITVVLLTFTLLLAPACKKRPQPNLPPLPQFSPEPATDPMPVPEPIPLAPVIYEPGATAETGMESSEVFGVPAVPPGPSAEPTPPVVILPEPAPLPSLAPLLPAEERRRYNIEIDSKLERANRNISLLQGRNLTARQRTSLDRVRAFVRQAESVRERDPATAAGLASRAAILSQELLSNTR